MFILCSVTVISVFVEEPKAEPEPEVVRRTVSPERVQPKPITEQKTELPEPKVAKKPEPEAVKKTPEAPKPRGKDFRTVLLETTHVYVVWGDLHVFNV